MSSAADPVETFTLGSGALIALERAAPAMTALLMRVRAGQARLIVPDGVLAQIWRGGTGRQARISTLLGLKPERCATVPLETAAAKRIGLAIVVTSNRDDILTVAPDLQERIVEI